MTRFRHNAYIGVSGAIGSRYQDDAHQPDGRYLRSSISPATPHESREYLQITSQENMQKRCLP